MAGPVTIRVLKPGMLTTVQDSGRPGFQRSGMPVAGAMDHYSFQVANWLCGNVKGEAALEATLIGPHLEFSGDSVIAITGGDLQPKLNGREVEMWARLFVREGDVLAFGSARKGCRAYIAFAGGIDVPSEMGSRSTYLRGEMGGFKGRALRAGDVVPMCNTGLPLGDIRVRREMIPDYGAKLEARVILGPQRDSFTGAGVEVFLSGEYRVSPNSDRMGYRLTGSTIEHRGAPGIVSDAIPAGAVQVPGDGLPIILMADRQTAGGYPKIAVAITPDLPRVGQLKPGDLLSFTEVSISEAHRLLASYSESLSALSVELQQ